MIFAMRRTVACHFARSFAYHFALTVALLSIVAAASAQTAEWKTYTYPADGFSASYPLAPDLQKRTIPTDAGAFELHSYVEQNSAATLFVGVCDYGPQAANKDAGAVLQGAKNGVLQNSNARLISEKKITLGTYSGVEFEAESDQAHVTARFYLVGTTLYQALVVSPLGKPYADTTRFLDAFQLITRPAS